MADRDQPISNPHDEDDATRMKPRSSASSIDRDIAPRPLIHRAFLSGRCLPVCSRLVVVSASSCRRRHPHLHCRRRCRSGRRQELTLAKQSRKDRSEKADQHEILQWILFSGILPRCGLPGRNRDRRGCLRA